MSIYCRRVSHGSCEVRRAVSVSRVVFRGFSRQSAVSRWLEQRPNAEINPRTASMWFSGRVFFSSKMQSRRFLSLRPPKTAGVGVFLPNSEQFSSITIPIHDAANLSLCFQQLASCSSRNAFRFMFLHGCKRGVWAPPLSVLRSLPSTLRARKFCYGSPF